MDSPSGQLQPRVEESTFFNHNEPSSPFVTETESRLVSKTFDAPTKDYNGEQQHTMDVFATPRKPNFDNCMDDKENVPQDNTANTIHGIAKPATPPERKALPDSPPMSRARSGSVSDAPRDSADSDVMPPPPPSTRKAQTPKRCPLKPSTSAAGAQTPRAPPSARKNSFESELTRTTTRSAGDSFEVRTTQQYTHVEENSGLDDTCFSAFSEVPDMTTWAKMGQTSARRGDALRTPGKTVDATPRTSRKRPSPSRSPSPTPRRAKNGQEQSASGDGTTFLIDFTQQMDNMGGHSRKTSPAKSATQPDLLKFMNSQRSPQKTTRQSYATPAKQSSIMNLLDFELPPAPTPRSVPTITVRELESLKSSYLSQISSLKATLSGREAEVESLKRAVGDAERRVGEAQESLREEKNRCDYAEEQKAGWERRGQEVEHLLKEVKEEVMKSEAEKEELLRKVEDFERRAEEAESRAIKAEERFAESLAARAMTGENGEVDPAAMEEQVQRLVAAQIDSKIEAVSRELHSVYKEKHERKVATLKKSYEARGEKKVAEIHARLQDLEKEHADLLAAKDATFSGPVADATFSGEAEAELKYQIEEQRALIARLEAEFQVSKQHHEQLERELQQERIEKGDLVAAVDEMLLLQSESQKDGSKVDVSVVEDFRKSISRPVSALRAPGGGGGSRIGGSGIGRPASGIVRSGGMMSRIEKMGAQRSGAAHD